MTQMVGGKGHQTFPQDSAGELDDRSEDHQKSDGADAIELRARADEQAERLAPRGVAPQFLSEAIWHRTLAVGSPPTDAEVVEYLARCAADHVPISGRQEHQPAIQPIERYRAPDGTVVVVERRARDSYAAVVVGDRERAIFSRSRARIHRDVEERWPGGTWSYTLAQRDRAEILRRWPEPP